MSEEYIIVCADDFYWDCGHGDSDSPEDLAFRVNVKIKEGYIPLGGPVIRHGSSHGAKWAQAMVKK